MTFVFKTPDGRFSKQYRTYMNCFRAAFKVCPFDTDRMIYKIVNGQIKPVLG